METPKKNSRWRASALIASVAITLAGCEGQPRKLSEKKVETTIEEIFSAGEAHRWHREKTETGSTSTMLSAPIPGSLDVTEVRFSDSRERIMISVDHESDGGSMELSCILERDEFGVYYGALDLPDELWVPLEVKEPSP